MSSWSLTDPSPPPPPKKKQQQQQTQEAAKPHQSTQWRPFFFFFSNLNGRQEMALTVPGGRYFRQTGQKADWIGCSSLKTCFDQNADKQPLDRLGRRLPRLFFSLLPTPQTGHYWFSCHLSWPVDKGKKVEMGGF